MKNKSLPNNIIFHIERCLYALNIKMTMLITGDEYLDEKNN